MFDWNWVNRNSEKIVSLLLDHAILSFVPILLALLIALPLGILCVRWERIYPLILGASAAAFAVPSIALFVFMLPFTGLSKTTAIVPLTLYMLSLLIRGVVDGIRSTDESVRQAAAAMGYSEFRRILTIELPIATPIIIGTLRTATVANIGMVAVTSVLGLPSLGDLFVDGTQRFFLTPIFVGIALTVALAAASDLILLGTQRKLTPWTAGSRTA